MPILHCLDRDKKIKQTSRVLNDLVMKKIKEFKHD